MSRSYRGIKTIGKRERATATPPTQKQMIARSAHKLAKAMKHQLIDDGLILDPATRPPHYHFNWVWGNLNGAVAADNTGEARKLIKANLRLPKNKRLPQDVSLTRTTNLDYHQEVTKTLENIRTCVGQDQVGTDVGADNSLADGGDGG